MKKILFLFGLLVFAFNVNGFATSPDFRISDNDGHVLNINADGTIPIDGGGSSLILDLADDDTNESDALGEIAITNDTGSVWSEPSDDKLLFNGTNLLYESELDTFAELDTQIADETIVNTNDAQTLTNKTISGSSNTLSNIDISDSTNLAGGTNGVDMSGDTINLDLTEIGTSTFGSGSSITFTYNVGAVDPVTAYTSGKVEFNPTNADIDYEFNTPTLNSLLYLNSGTNAVGIGSDPTTQATRLYMNENTTGGSLQLIYGFRNSTASSSSRGLEIRMDQQHTSGTDGQAIYGMLTKMGGSNLGTNSNEVVAWSIDSRPTFTGTWTAYHAAESLFIGGASSTVTTMKGFEINHSTSGSITTSYGIHIDALGGSTNVAYEADEGSFTHNDDAGDYDATFKGDTDTALLVTDAGNDAVNVGGTGSAAKLDVTQNNASGAIPVLELDQDDIDDVFINFVGTSAADGTRSISSDTTTDASKTGAIRVEINGTVGWLRVWADES